MNNIEEIIMAVVEDPVETRIQADILSNNILYLISQESKKTMKDDAAEHIYFLGQVVGTLMAKSMVSLINYGTLLNGFKLDKKNTKEWLDKICKEYISEIVEKKKDAVKNAN